jgi:hypothetical protein
LIFLNKTSILSGGTNNNQRTNGQGGEAAYLITTSDKGTHEMSAAGLRASQAKQNYYNQDVESEKASSTASS